MLRKLVARVLNQEVAPRARDPRSRLHLGEGSRIDPPRQLDGAEYIRIGARTQIRAGVWLSAFDSYGAQRFQPRLVIGDGVYVGHFACIVCVSEIVIGDGCVLSEYAYVTDHGHGIDPEAGPIRAQPLVTKGGVRIGDNTFVGYQACVLSGVTLGRHCVVGANAVVTRSFPDYSMVVGSPARLVKRYSPATRRWEAVERGGEVSRLD